MKEVISLATGALVGVSVYNHAYGWAVAAFFGGLIVSALYLKYGED